MNDRPRDDEQSASDWLAAQFGTPGEQPPAPTTPPATPPAQQSAPPVAPAGGFSWGLRPGASAGPVTDPARTPDAAGPAEPAAPEPLTPIMPAWLPGAGPVVPEESAGRPTPPPPVPPVPPVDSAPPVAPPPTARPADHVPPPVQQPSAAPVPPPAQPSAPSAQRPATSVPPTAAMPPAAVPPASAAPVPPPLVEPPAPTAEQTPTVAWSPPSAPPAASWEQATQAMPMPTQATPAPAPPSIPPQAAAGLAATERMGSASIGADASTTSGLEALFGEENFRDYTAEPAPSQSPFARRPDDLVAAPTEIAPSRAEISRTQKILLGVAGGLVALLALFALFLLGTRLGDLTGSAAEPSSTPTPSTSPTATIPPLGEGPLEPGVWAWNELLGGECIDPYDDPWAVEFTVVDCADPHPAQLAFRGIVPPIAEGVAGEGYPGAEALLAQVQELCAAPGVVDLSVAWQFTDLQVEVAFPADEAQWDSGERTYFCFVSRSSGEPLTGSVAAPAPVEG